MTTPDASDLAKYNAWHDRRAEGEGGGSLALVHPWHITVARLLPDLNGQRVLEVGCGRGDFSIWLGERFPQARIVGVDFSAAAIDIARRRGAEVGSAVEFLVDDAEALSFADAEFDWVISCECLEHVHRPERMAGSICRVLKPGGRFVLTTENYFNGMLLAWLMSWMRRAPFESGSGVQPHENFFLFWRVKALLERGGLRVQAMESNHFQWLLLPRVDPAKLVTLDFRSPILKRLFRPFGRHFTFSGVRPT